MDLTGYAAAEDGLPGATGASGATGPQGPAGSVIGGLGEDVTPFDFMDATDQADVIARTLMYDHTAAVQSALTSGAGEAVKLLTGTYSINQYLMVSSDTAFYGTGHRTILKLGASATRYPWPVEPGGYVVGSNAHILMLLGVSGITISSMHLDDTANSGGKWCIVASESSDYKVHSCKFQTRGGAVISWHNSHHYQVLDNIVDVFAANTDGVIDQWDGAHDFTIKGNIVNGNGFGRYGILQTATNTDAVGTPMYNFAVLDNIVKGMRFAGIWPMGSSGGVSNFRVSGNQIFDTWEGSGLQLDGASNFAVDGNLVKNSTYSGIWVHRLGPTWPNSEYGSINNNVVVDPSTTSHSGIIVQNANKIAVSGNIIRGTYPYAISMESTSSNCEVNGNLYQSGSSGGIRNLGLNNNIII